MLKLKMRQAFCFSLIQTQQKRQQLEGLFFLFETMKTFFPIRKWAMQSYRCKGLSLFNGLTSATHSLLNSFCISRVMYFSLSKSLGNFSVESSAKRIAYSRMGSGISQAKISTVGVSSSSSNDRGGGAAWTFLAWVSELKKDNKVG